MSVTTYKDKNLDEIMFNFMQGTYEFEKRETQKHNLTWESLYLLQILKREKHLRITEIAELLQIPMFKASRLVSRLIENNLLLREQDSVDKRNRFVSISDEGETKLIAINQQILKNFKSNLELLNDQEVENFVHAMANIGKLLN